MAIVICNMEKCKYLSKKPLRKWKFKDGGKCYGCTLEAISISRIPCFDGWERDVVGEENMAKCNFYTPIENDENIEDIE